MSFSSTTFYRFKVKVYVLILLLVLCWCNLLAGGQFRFLYTNLFLFPEFINYSLFKTQKDWYIPIRLWTFWLGDSNIAVPVLSWLAIYYFCHCNEKEFQDAVRKASTFCNNRSTNCSIWDSPEVVRLWSSTDHRVLWQSWKPPPAEGWTIKPSSGQHRPYLGLRWNFLCANSNSNGKSAVSLPCCTRKALGILRPESF